jgi:hypothetical protein
VGAVDHRDDAALAGAPAELPGGKRPRGAGRVVAHEEHACAWSCFLPDRVHELLAALDRETDRRPHVPCAGLVADTFPGEVERAVLQVGCEHLVAGLEPDPQAATLTAAVAFGTKPRSSGSAPT